MDNRVSFKNKYGSTGTVFPDNTTGEISEGDMRNFGEDLADSHFNLQTDAYSGAKGIYPNVASEAAMMAIDTLNLPINVVVIYRDTGSGQARVYQLTAGTDAESSPSILRPHDYAGGTNEKIWKLGAVGTIPAILELADVAVDGDTIDWEMTGLQGPEAELNTAHNAMYLNLKNFSIGDHAGLLLFKTSADDLTLQFKYNGNPATPVFIMPEFSSDLHDGLVISSEANTFIRLEFDNHAGTSFNCVIVKQIKIV